MSINNLNNLQRLIIDDFNQICRTCASNSELEDLYSNSEIIDMLKFCNQMQYLKEDKLPDKICTTCIIQLKNAFKFINTCKITDEAYRKCLFENSKEDIKLEPIFQCDIKEEYNADMFEIKHEIPEPLPTSNTTEPFVETTQDDTMQNQLIQNQILPESERDKFLHDKFLHDTIRIGNENNCNSLLMRYFKAKVGAETLSMHLLMTSFKTVQTADDFLNFARNQMTVELCCDAANQTKRNTELRLELRYGRITASKMHSIACCKKPDEYYMENIIGFYKINETKDIKLNEINILKEIDKQLNLKRKKTGIILNRNFPEFVSNPEGVTDEAVIKIKYPRNAKDISKYILKEGGLTAKIKTEIHLHMLMSNVKVGYICVADPNFSSNSKVTIIKVDYNERYFSEILKKNREFWKLYVFQTLHETVGLIRN